MPTQKFRVDTDKGSYEIEVEVPEEKQGPSLLERANTPLVDVRGNPTVHAATEQFAKEHPYIGGALNATADTLSSMSSPATLGLAALTGGSGIAEKLGAERIASALRLPSRIAGGAAVAHGAEKTLTAPDLPTALGGVLETTGGAAGLGIGKPGIRVVGKGLEYVGEHPMATRMAGGAGIMGGLYRGSPEMIAAGVATQAAPPILANLGKRMVRYGGGETSEMLKSGHMPSSSRDIDTGPVKSLRLGAPASSAPSTERVPNVGMPATANARVQKVQMDEARSEAAAARGQAKNAAKDALVDDPMVTVNGVNQRLSTMTPNVQAKYRAMMGIPDPNLGSTIKTGSPTRPTIRPEEPPTTRGRTSDVPPADALHPDKSDLASVLRPGVTPSEMMTPDNPEWFKGSGVRIGRPPVAVQPSADLDKLLAETKVPTDLRVEGEEGINPLPPSAGDALSKETSTPVHESQGFKDLQSAVRTGPAKLTPDTPSNLLMGSELPPTEMMGDIRARAQGGGVRVSGRNPIQLVPGTAPLSAEAQSFLDQFLKENPGADRNEAIATIRKLSGQ